MLVSARLFTIFDNPGHITIEVDYITQYFTLQVRSFSTSNISNQLVKPPVQLFGIDGRYATALYSAATKQKTLDAVEKDLLKFQAAVKTDAKLREFIKNPTIKRGLKAEALKQIASKISLNPQTSNLLQTLAENGRLKNLNGVINSFKIIMSAHRGEVLNYIHKKWYFMRHF